MHFSASATISVKATPYHIENFLKPICEGIHLTTLVLSETGTGTHFYFSKTKLFDTSENIFRVNGQKSFVTKDNFADSFVFSTIAIDSTNLEGLFSLLLAKNGSPGLSWGKEWEGLGMKGNNSRTLNIENLQIEKKNLLSRALD
jgi:isovaleryl-CoA dehydrogenase